MKNCVVIINMFNDEAVEMSGKVSQILQQEGFVVSRIEYSGQESCEANLVDLVVTLGGDGTVLFAARNFASLGIPIFPINLGEFGFISAIHKDLWQKELKLYLDKKLPVFQRNMLSISVFRGETKLFSKNVLNDGVLSADGVARLVNFDIWCDSIPFGKFTSDGIIVATATGSTAYSAAAGGPIVDPALDVFILNPICAFSLSNRPLVLPGTSHLEIKIIHSRGTKVALTCDGQVVTQLAEGDCLRIEKAQDKALLVGCHTESFYDALRSKLHWSGAPK